MAKKAHTPSRRAMLAGLAAAPLAGDALAESTDSLPDPIFAAIERHRLAFDEFVRLSSVADEISAISDRRSVTKEDEAALDASELALDETMKALLVTTPATMAGALAAIEYLVEYEDGRVPHHGAEFLPSLLRSPIFKGVVQHHEPTPRNHSKGWSFPTVDCATSPIAGERA